MCFDEATGQFLWQSVHDKLATGQVNDWPYEGVASTPTVDGESRLLRLQSLRTGLRHVGRLGGRQRGRPGRTVREPPTPTSSGGWT